MTSSSRDDFPEPTKRTLAARVNYRCSRPECRAQTSGPQTEPGKALNVGVAAHVTGAAPGGPRYDRNLTAEQRADIGNAIWLCQTCAKLVDNDPIRFGASVLREWKARAEREALDLVGKTGSNRELGAEVVDKWVNLSYVENAGITKQLTDQGYDLRWTAANEESERVDLDGWEPVVVDQADGTLARLKIRDHPVIGGYLILLKKKRL
jgi:hypothetical protein